MAPCGIHDTLNVDHLRDELPRLAGPWIGVCGDATLYQSMVAEENSPYRLRATSIGDFQLPNVRSM